LAKLRLKDKLKADLKEMGLNRDVLKMIRSNHDGTEADSLRIYQRWIESLIAEYETSLDFDQQLHAIVSNDIKYHWMY
jgi:hypothetical protein